MYLNRKQKGYGWYTKVVSKDLNTDAERTGYVNFSFKKDCEPTDDTLGEYGSYEADLYLIDKHGKRRVFPTVHEYNGNSYIEFKILGYEDQKPTTNKMAGSRSDIGQTVDIEPDDLPFY